MGNPWCPNCTAKGKPFLLVTKSMNTKDQGESLIKKTLRGIAVVQDSPTMRGRAKFWYCKQCKRKWKKGAEQIKRK